MHACLCATVVSGEGVRGEGVWVCMHVCVTVMFCRDMYIHLHECT